WDLWGHVEHRKNRHLDAAVQKRLVLLEGLDAERRSRMNADFRVRKSALKFRDKDASGAVARIDVRRPLVRNAHLAALGGRCEDKSNESDQRGDKPMFTCVHAGLPRLEHSRIEQR